VPTEPAGAEVPSEAAPEPARAEMPNEPAPVAGEGEDATSAQTSGASATEQAEGERT
jgi:hypothetical protein